MELCNGESIDLKGLSNYTDALYNIIMPPSKMESIYLVGFKRDSRRCWRVYGNTP